MISSSAKLDLSDRTITIELQVSPENASIAPTYQDFLDKLNGPISVDLNITQEKDHHGCILHHGHGIIKLVIHDADDVDVEIHDSEDDLPMVEEVEKIKEEPSLLESMKARIAKGGVVKL